MSTTHFDENCDEILQSDSESKAIELFELFTNTLQVQMKTYEERLIRNKKDIILFGVKCVMVQVIDAAKSGKTRINVDVSDLMKKIRTKFSHIFGELFDDCDIFAYEIFVELSGGILTVHAKDHTFKTNLHELKIPISWKDTLIE